LCVITHCIVFFSSFLTLRLPPPPTLFPYTTLFRSRVTPEVNRIRVLTSGRPQAGMVWKAPPTAPGPLVGHAAEKPSHNSPLVISPWPSPPSHGRPMLRVRSEERRVGEN